jgi:hypothetical protein
MQTRYLQWWELQKVRARVVPVDSEAVRQLMSTRAEDGLGALQERGVMALLRITL